MKTKQNYIPVFIVFVFGCIGVILVWGTENSAGGLLKRKLQDSRAEEPRIGQVPKIGKLRTSDRDEIEALGDVGGKGVAGVVVDSLSGKPIRALVTGDWFEPTESSGRSGRFELAELPPEDDSISINAQNYKPASKTVTKDARDLGVFRLETSLQSSVVVLSSEGSPVKDVVVDWSFEAHRFGTRPISASRVQSPIDAKVFLTSKTNYDGRSQAATGHEVVAKIRDPENPSVPLRVRIPAGQERIVSIPECYASVAFLNADSGKPIPGMDVEWVQGTNWSGVSSTNETDGQGILRLPGGEGPILIRRAMNLYSQAWSLEETLSPRAKAARMARLTIEPDCFGVTFVWVHTSATYLEVVDAETDISIDGAIFNLSSEPTDDKKQRKSYSIDSPAGFPRSPRISQLSIARTKARQKVVVNGRVEFPGNDQFIKLGNAPNHPRSKEPTLWVEGYEPVTIEEWDSVLSGDWKGPLLLEPAKTRRLSISFADGQPYCGPVTLVSYPNRLYHYAASGAGDCEEPGIYGPFDWSSQALTLTCGKRTIPIGVDLLTNNSVVDVELQGSTGTIVIQNVPSLTPAIGARSATSFWWKPVRLEEGTSWIIEGLQPGRYIVGPEMWTRSCLGNQAAGSGPGAKPVGGEVHVVAGQRIECQWNKNWYLEDPVTGSVQWNGGDRNRLVLVPIFGLNVDRQEVESSIPTIAFNFDGPLMFLDSKGQYVIPNGEPRPDLIMVCLPNKLANEIHWESPNSFRVLGNLPPGESLSVETGDVELVARTSAAQPLICSYQVEPGSLSVPLNSTYQTEMWYWKPKEAGDHYVVRSVPSSVEHMTIGGQEISIKIKPGRSVKVEL